MKPVSIRNFDVLYLGSIALSVAGFALSYGAMVDQAQADLAANGAAEAGDGLVSGFLITGMVISLLFSLGLWFLISVKRIEFVKWVLIALFVLGLFFLLGILDDGIQATDVTTIVGTLMSAAALYFLFRPDAKAWFTDRREHDPL